MDTVGEVRFRVANEHMWDTASNTGRIPQQHPIRQAGRERRVLVQSASQRRRERGGLDWQVGSDWHCSASSDSYLIW